MLDDKP